MDFRKEGLSCSDARNYDMVDYLASLGLEPVKIKGNDFWYLSPFRGEREPSFKIDRKRNRWYDFGDGKGGNLIDFAIRYNQCTIGELLQSLSGSAAVSFLRPQPLQQTGVPAFREPRITILHAFVLTSAALLRYLKERRISITLADDYCREVRYQIGEKIYYAIGFRNDSGGYELRNPYFKGSSSKDITTIRNGATDIAVFEGFFDFLSFLTLMRSGDGMPLDYLILNSLSLFEKSRPVMEGYDHIHLYLDNNTAGQNCSLYATSLSPKYIDQSQLYSRYDDVNDWLNNKPMIIATIPGQDDQPP